MFFIAKFLFFCVGRIPFSLINKLGVCEGLPIALRLPLKRQAIRTFHKTDITTTTLSKPNVPLLGTTKITRSITNSNSSSPSDSPRPSSSSVGTSSKLGTLMATKLIMNPPRHDRVRTIQVNDNRTPTPLHTHLGKIDPTAKKVASEKAQAGLQEMLRRILDWDIFNLDSLQLIESFDNHLPEKLPLIFDDVESFRE